VYNISQFKDTQICPEWAECGSDFFTGSSAIAASQDTDSTVYYMYGGDDTSTEESTETRVMFTSLSSSDVSDPDAAFAHPVDISDAPLNENIYHGFVLLAAGATAGDVRAAWMDNRTGMWNIYYRESTDFGATWSSPSVRLSWSTGFSFQDDDGFLFPYGDYGSMIVAPNGMTHIVWGEGLGWYAGGTVMHSYQTKGGSGSNGSDDGEWSDGEWIALYVVITGVVSILVGAVGALFIVGYFNTKGEDNKLLGTDSKGARL
jgi:hypothetical protein